MSTETPVESAESRVRTDQVTEKLEQLILDGHYRPGEKLREQALADELGVGRAPLREAIRTLEGRRLLERTPRSGVQVVGLSIEDLEQILITREALEGMTARQAAENMTVAEVNALRQAALAREATPEAASDAVYRSGPDNDFHRLIARGSRNQWLEGLLIRDVYSLLRIYRVQAARRPDVSDSLAEHQAIIDRIHARDGDGAEAAMRAHLRGARERAMALARG